MTVPTDPPTDAEVVGISADIAEVLAPHAAGLQKEAMRASWWTAVQAIIGLPLSVGANLIVTRLLGPSEFGRVATYMAEYGIILTILNGGISDATIQWGAAAHARGDRAELLEIARRCAGYHMIVEGPIGAIATVVLLHRESAVTQLVGGLAVAITMLLGTTVVVMTAMSLNTILAKLNLVVGLGIQLAVVTAAVQTHAAGPTWVARIALSVVGPLLVVAVAPKDVRRASMRPLLPFGWPDGFARYSARTLVAGLVATLVFSRCEILVLDAYGDTVAAGLFALAAGLASQLTSPVDAMLGPLIPAAASLTAIDRERAARAVSRGMRLSTLITAPLAMIAIPLVAVVVPVVYGSRYGSTGSLFVALGIVSCLQSAMHPVTAFVAALRKPLLVLTINAVALVVDLGLAIALIPEIGAAGAVVANSAGQVLSLALSTYLLRREFGYSFRDALAALRPFVLIAAGSALGTAFGVEIVKHGMHAWVGAVVALAAACTIGIVACAATGGIVMADDMRAVEEAMPRAAILASKVLKPIGMITSSTHSEIGTLRSETRSPASSESDVSMTRSEGSD